MLNSNLCINRGTGGGVEKSRNGSHRHDIANTAGLQELRWYPIGLAAHVVFFPPLWLSVYVVA